MDGDNLNAQPTGQVTCEVLDEDGSSIETFNLPIKDRYGNTGSYFHKRHLLGDLYTASKSYFAVMAWTISAVVYKKVDNFTILAGGDAKGSVVALAAAEQPEKVAVIYETESGDVRFGRNPS